MRQFLRRLGALVQDIILGGLGVLVAVAVLSVVRGRGKGKGARMSLRVSRIVDDQGTTRPLFDVIAGDHIFKAVEGLRPLGFFAKSAHVSDKTLARDMHQRVENMVERPASSGSMSARPANWWTIARNYESRSSNDPAELDLLAAGEDPSRVWWEDLDQVRREHNGYIRMLQRWAEISRGVFQPRNVSESWGADGEPVVVSFELAGIEHAFIHLTSLDSQLDTAGLRTYVNPLIADSGIQFEIIAFHDTPNIVLALTREERYHLENARGWRFAEIPALLA